MAETPAYFGESGGWGLTLANMVAFDWVTARAHCSLFRMFKELEFGAREDVKIANSLCTAGDPYEFTVTDNSSGTMFAVFRQTKRTTSPAPQKSVDFHLEDKTILVKHAFTEDISATLTLDNDGHCKLRMKDQELEQWQFRRMALEGLLFGGP